MLARVAVVVIALALGFAAVPVAGAGNAISDQTTCRDLSEQGITPIPVDNCFAGSTARRAIVAGLLVLAAGAAVLAMIAGAVVATRGNRGIQFISLVPFALLALAAIGIFFTAYAAARV